MQTIVSYSCPFGSTYKRFVPFTSGDWTGSLRVLFGASAITMTGVAPHYAYKTIASGINVAGTKIYCRFKYQHATSGAPPKAPYVGFGSNVSIADITWGVLIAANTNRVVAYFDNNPDLVGSYALVNGTTYQIEFEITVLGSASQTIEYWLYDATGATLLETNSSTQSRTLPASAQIGFNANDVGGSEAFFELMDLWIYGPSLSQSDTCLGIVPSLSQVLPAISGKVSDLLLSADAVTLQNAIEYHNFVKNS